ncbi:MAG: glycosyltransferase family 39 protein [Victivallaceae bacterium]|nr:glycosyltransferase family 39 protein [Victivallaceae bacterium]
MNFRIITSFIRERRREIFWVALLTLTAFTVRMVVAVPGFADMPEHFSRPDTPGYLLPALALARDGNFDSAPGSGEKMSGRPPGFSLLIATVFKLFGESYAALITILSLIAALTLIPVYLSGRLWGGIATGAAAAALFGFNITAIALSPMLLTDSFFTFFAAWQFFFFILFCRNKKIVWCFAAIATAALSALIRPIAAVWIFPALFLIAIMPGLNIKRKLITAMGSLIIFYMILTPWMFRNYRNGAGFCIDTNTGAMYHQNGAMLLAKVNGTDYEDEKQRLIKEIDAEFEDKAKYPDGASQVNYRIALFRRLIFKYPLTYFSMHFSPHVLIPDAATFSELLGITSSDRGTLNVLKSQGIVAAIKHYFNGRTGVIALIIPLLLIPALCYAGALWQLIKWLAEKQFFMFFLFLAFVEYYLFLPGPITVPRYHLPALPMLSAMAALALVPAVRKINEQLKDYRLNKDRNNGFSK